MADPKFLITPLIMAHEVLHQVKVGNLPKFGKLAFRMPVAGLGMSIDDFAKNILFAAFHELKGAKLVPEMGDERSASASVERDDMRAELTAVLNRSKDEMGVEIVWGKMFVLGPAFEDEKKS